MAKSESIRYVVTQMSLPLPLLVASGVVVSDAFAAKVVERALNEAGDVRRACLVNRVGEWLALIIRRNFSTRDDREEANRREKNRT
jgi:hypothetical protein